MPPVLALALALLGISFAAPLVRLSGAHPVVIALWRLAFSLVMVGAMLVVTGTWRQSIRVKRIDNAKPIEMRSYLRSNNTAISETWSYILPPE